MTRQEEIADRIDVARAYADRIGDPPLRILAVSALWQGANDYAFVRAFRRAGHSVSVVPEEWFMAPGLRNKGLRLLRRLLRPALVAEYSQALIAEAEQLQPDLFFVFKGSYVTPEALRAIKSNGAVAINFYPDVSFTAHGPYIPKTLPLYDWVFTTKTFGLTDMRLHLGIHNTSFLPHSFDPETHVPVGLSQSDHKRYDCDVSFIGTWSPKKQKLLEFVLRSLPDARMRIWGAQWEKSGAALGEVIEGRGVLGIEYAKAICASAINLGILSEARRGSSSGDLITSRTFQIPAAGGFMLHERTHEALQYFVEDRECAFFSDADELVAKAKYYLRHPEERDKIAEAGRKRSLSSGYSVDARAESILAKYAELSGEGKQTR